MKLLSRLSIVSALLMLPACVATLAQNPQEDRPVVRYSAEELDNLVAPVALYPDALLAQVLVAATFPDDVGRASRYVGDRGSKGIDEQDWDVSVKSIAHYPSVLNMLATQDDWAVALGQAYAAQPDDVMDAVQRLRAMAREQGNLVTTPEQTVTVRRQYVVIEPANPEVIYVPTYDPYYVYSYPVYRYGFFTNHFSFGIGFPIGPWLGYDVDWFAHRVYYHGWYAGGWRRYSPRWGVIPVYVYHGPRFVRPNVYVFVRPVNYVNLDRRYRYVRRDVNFVRHDRNWGRNNGDRDDDRRGPRSGSGDRDGWRGDDRPGRDDNGPPNGNGNGGGNGRGNGNGNGNGGENGRGNGNGNGRGRSSGNERDGARVASFDDIRPEKGGTAETRTGEPVMRSGFDKVGKPATPETGRESRGDGPTIFRGSSGSAPVYVTPPRAVEGKSRSSGPVVYRGSTRTSTPTFTTSPRAEGTKARSNGTAVNRGSRPVTPGFSSGARAAGGKAKEGAAVYRGVPRSTANGNKSGNGGSSGSVTVRPSGGGKSTTAKSSGSAKTGGGGKHRN
jgi:uncharacterized protein DUF3300